MDNSCIFKYSLKHTHTPTHNMVNPLSYFLFQSLLHKLYNKSRGMYYSVYGIVHIKDTLLTIRQSCP